MGIFFLTQSVAKSSLNLKVNPRNHFWYFCFFLLKFIDKCIFYFVLPILLNQIVEEVEDVDDPDYPSLQESIVKAEEERILELARQKINTKMSILKELGDEYHLILQRYIQLIFVTSSKNFMMKKL